MAEATASQNNHNLEEPLFREIRKRDGRVVKFEPIKITDAIFKAVQAVGGVTGRLLKTLPGR